jgi:hypothetical protein
VPQEASAADAKIWPEFVSLMKSGRISEEHLRPAYVSKPTMLQFLMSMRASASWPEWEKTPEMHRVGSLVHFVIELSEHGARNTYSFTFVTEGGRWFLQHFEAIVIRLDKVGPAPVSTFPDLEEGQKAWMRQETYWSKMMWIFGRMRKAAGDEAAFNMFLDGAGYLVAARTWVPLVPPERAFILYACWEQSRLVENPVTLEKFTDTEAVITFDSTYLRLYRQTGHMRTLVSEEDYRRIFELIWRDRATAAGWAVQFSYDGTRCTLRLARAGT